MPHFEDSMKGEDSSLEPIAICGMACRLPGAVDSASSLWELLEKKGSGQTPKVPASRFNIDAHYHENLERPGSFNVLGGYFLDGPLENFDPTFFNMTPIEAMWMDPQQRKMLEVSYECLESAGRSLDSVAGSNTAVFVGSFTSDYQQISIRDTDFRHNYAATGVDPGIISNRIGNVFNLKGPSFTINTACSSSIYAIHNACHALRAHDCEAAIAGGVNLILTVDQHMNTAKLGILSPTSTCHTFDASADGYGRAEGAGALYMKRLSDAIRDGDPVRGVIRSSAVNTNGKVAGMGITHPSVKGQERVVRAAYERANLDPNKTAYLECHGTGTPVGDPIEVRAVSNAMNDKRSKEAPLLIGAIKANIGHSEAASGIFAVMKAAMMTEKGVIPGVSGFKNLNPAILEKDWNVQVQRDTAPWPAKFDSRRASVSSFGYGGTNGHVIVEDVTALYPWYQHGLSKAEAPYNHSTSRPLLIGFSAHDKPTLTRNIVAHGKVADKFYLADLAHTLNHKRTKLSQRAFVIAQEGQEAAAFAAPTFGSAGKVKPKLGFMFTGQGAQWAGMGAEAMKTFPSFHSTIQALDSVLQDLESPPTWTLEEALNAPAETSRIGDAEISQPVCTAIQIAIVDLFAQWDIIPTVTVGHSSGEIGAAYAAGLISAPEAILAAFYRGYAVKHNTPMGTMLAAGLGAKEVAKYLENTCDGGAVIACENSGNSVTLSGTSAAIQEAKKRLDADGVFARELRTGKAYHSPHMAPVAPIYNELLSTAVQRLDKITLGWRRPLTRMVSSVTGTELPAQPISAEYWSQNLRSRVLFDSAIIALGKTADLEDVKCMIEIGPHSALGGPFKQICKMNGFDRFDYVPTFVRNNDSAIQLLKAAGELFTKDYPLSMAEVNREETGRNAIISKKSHGPFTLVDLPPYQWNYEKTYWAESRFSQEQRNMTHLRHDLVGSKIQSLSANSPVWRNFLRHRDIPWLIDHKLGGDVVFPAAGHMSCAIEAVRQMCENSGTQVTGVTFRDVAIKTALIVPMTDDGIEIQVRLSRATTAEGANAWYSFVVESYADSRWTAHCEGRIFPKSEPQTAARDTSSPVVLSKLTQRVPGKRWYDAFNKVGFEYGPSFQRLSTIRTDSKYQDAAAQVKISDASDLMTGESRYILHPSTIDACLQLIIISINHGLHKEMPWGVVPIQIEEASLWFPNAGKSSSGNAVAWTDEQDGRYFNTHTKLMTESGQLVMDIKGLRCVAYEAAVPQQVQSVVQRQPYIGLNWKPDISSLTTAAAVQTYPELASVPASLAKTVELIDHKSPLGSVFLLGLPSAEILEGILKTVPASTLITLADNSTEALESELVTSNERITTFVEAELDFQEFASKAQDLVIVSEKYNGKNIEKTLLPAIKSLTNTKGNVILLTKSEDGEICAESLFLAGFSGADLFFPLPDGTMILSKVEPYTNGVLHGNMTIVAANTKAPALKTLQNELSKHSYVPEIKNIKDFDASTDKKVVIYDVEGTLLSDTNAETFTGLKSILISGGQVVWLSTGANEGKSVTGAMSQGFLRAIRSERANARITLLDIDTTEKTETVGEAITSKLETVATKDSGADTEFWLHGGVLYTQRALPNDELNDKFSAGLQDPTEGILEAEKLYSGNFVSGELVYTPRDKVPELDNHEIELQVTAFEFDKSDFQSRSEGPRIVSGTILRVGKRVDKKLIGQLAVAYTSDFLSTLVRVPKCLCVTFNKSATTDLVATLPNLCKAVNAVLDTVKVHDKERVLQLVLLPAQLSAVQAFAGLSRALGFELVVVYKSEKDKEESMIHTGLSEDAFLAASNIDAIRGILNKHSVTHPVAVIAHDFSPLSQDIWRYMPPHGRFILNGGALTEAPDVLPFKKGASFLSTSISTLYAQDTKLLGQLLQSTMSMVHEFQSELLQKPLAWDIAELQPTSEKANENNVVTIGYGKSTANIQPSAPKLQLKSDAMYLLVGCLGGLGRSLTTWMMERGAKNFAFISRSGTDKAEAAQLVDSIIAAGANVEVLRADASNARDVQKIVKDLSVKWPIKGVVHAAMVLQDGIFETMTYEKFNAAVVPKVHGAQNLDAALENHDLDFFVMTSSISATLGNPGQANYCAANSYLDALAYQRRLAGKVATSLVLPMILDVGVVSENENIEMALSRKAMYGIDEREMLRGFETAMANSAPAVDRKTEIRDAQIVLGLEPAALGAAMASVDDTDDAYWYSDARFSSLRAAVEAADKAGSGRGGAGDFTGAVKAALEESEDRAIEVIAEHVMKKCSSILMVAVEDFEFNGQSVAEYGLDSMIGAELRNWLFKEFTLDMPFQHLLAPTLTFKGLSIAIAQTLGVLKKEE